jgi:molybdate transport system substrate-binding protein
MRLKILFPFLLMALLLTACAPQAIQTVPISPSATIEPAKVATGAPTEAPSVKPAPAQTLTVMAAASLTESFTELGKMFESKNPGVDVTFNFASSQQLAQQLDQGAEADVFASASPKYMDAAVKSKRVKQDDARPFVTNRLVVIFPKDNPAGVKELKELSKAGLKLDLGDKSVPVGQYALDFLTKATGDTKNYDAGFKDAVLKNVVSYETDVKAVVTKVSLGEADAGIVYITDYNAAANKLGKLDIPDALNSIARYPIAAIADSKNADLANAFIDLVLSPAGQDVLAKYGFIPAGTGSTTTGS